VTHVPEWGPVAFESATVEHDESRHSPILRVSGVTPSSGPDSLGVELHPVTYIVQPEYWVIAVDFDSADALFQSITPYTVSHSIKGFVGTRGIEVVGQGKSIRIDVPA
jgi:hypothetical protein